MLYRTCAAALTLAFVTACASTPDIETVIRERPLESSAEVRRALDESVEDSSGEVSSLIPSRRAVLEAQPFTREELLQESQARKTALDARCRELLEDARLADADYAALMAASRALVFNADLRIQTHLAFAFDPATLPDPSELIDAEDDVPSVIKDDVRSLAKESRSLADRALELRPGDAAGELFSTLGVGLSLWSMGPFQALANGAATTLPKRIKKIATDHPEFEGASPLRLKGRFQARAPWPYKDTAGGVETLERAVELAPIPLNLLFLGDAYWVDGQEANAIKAWKRASAATADAETELASPFLREISRLRVVAATSAGR